MYCYHILASMSKDEIVFVGLVEQDSRDWCIPPQRICRRHATPPVLVQHNTKEDVAQLR